MTIVICDNCGARVMGAIIRSSGDGEYCTMRCAIAAEGPADACAHEKRADATTHGTAKRMVCVACGDVEEMEIV